MQKKYAEKVFRIQDKCIWIGWFKVPLLWQEYLVSVVNGLKISSNFSDPTKRDVFSSMYARMMKT